MSTSSKAAQMVKPPVQVFGLEGRYASALFSAASKTKTLDTAEKELSSLQQSIKTDPKLKEFFFNPTIKRDLKVDALKHVSAQVSVAQITTLKKCLDYYLFEDFLTSTSLFILYSRSSFRLQLVTFLAFLLKMDA